MFSGICFTLFSLVNVNPSLGIFKSETRGACDRPDLDPQDRAVWPVGQVHMLGLEQKPSPHELRQIAAKEKRRRVKQHQKTRAVRWKTSQCLLYGARIWPANERKFMLCVCCLSACLLQVLNFKPHAEFWSTIFQTSNRPQSKYGHILLLTLIMVKLQEPTLKHLPAIFFSVAAINVHQCVFFGAGCFCPVTLFPTDCWHGLLPPVPIR